jgi:hypothetical protein
MDPQNSPELRLKAFAELAHYVVVREKLGTL